MSSHDNEAVLRRLYDEVVNGGNLAVVDELVAPDAIEHETVPGVEGGGPQAVRQWIGMARSAFPDFHLDVEDMIAEGDRVAARVTLSGTHQGEFVGMPPTGKHFSVNTIDIVRFADGKIAEHWGVTDNLGMMQQLGIIPTPEAPTA